MEFLLFKESLTHFSLLKFGNKKKKVRNFALD